MRIRMAARRIPGPCRSSALVAVGLIVVGALAGCSGDDGDQAAESASPSSSSASSSSPAGSSPTAGSSGSEGSAELASALLPVEAFGPDASVVPVSPEQLAQGAGLAGSLADVQITPEVCRTAVQRIQPAVEDFDEVAAERAAIGGTVIGQVLLRGGPTDGAVDQLTSAVEQCPRAQLDAPDLGQATITFEALPLPELGKAAAAVRFTTALDQADGTQVTVPTLVGLVEDDDRLMTLLSIDQGGGGGQDPADFTALLQRAYEVQAEALD